MEIEVKPEELKVPITRINVVKELMIPEKYLYHTLQLKKYYQAFICQSKIRKYYGFNNINKIVTHY